MRIDQIGRQWSGSLMIGLTTQTISESQPIMVTQATALDVHCKTKSTWIVNGPKGTPAYPPSFLIPLCTMLVKSLHCFIHRLINTVIMFMVLSVFVCMQVAIC